MAIVVEYGRRETTITWSAWLYFGEPGMRRFGYIWPKQYCYGPQGLQLIPVR